MVLFYPFSELNLVSSTPMIKQLSKITNTASKHSTKSKMMVMSCLSPRNTIDALNTIRIKLNKMMGILRCLVSWLMLSWRVVILMRHITMLWNLWKSWRIILKMTRKFKEKLISSKKMLRSLISSKIWSTTTTALTCACKWWKKIGLNAPGCSNKKQKKLWKQVTMPAVN